MSGKTIGRQLGDETEARITALRSVLGGIGATAVIRIAIAELAERKGVTIDEVKDENKTKDN